MSSLPADGADDRLRWSIVDAMRRYGTDASRIAQVFSAQNELRPVDLQALVAIMGAEGAGAALTPGALRTVLGLSSAGTSYVIDRLEKAGHVQRHRDHPDDNRVVHLRHTPHGQTTAQAFFGPLGRSTERVMDDFSREELEIIDRFLQRAARSMREHLEDHERRGATPD